MSRTLLMIQTSVLISLLLSASVLVTGQDMNQDKPTDPKFNVGQKWSYKARPGEEGSYLIIVKIDNDAKVGRIVHIALRGLKIKNPRSPEGISDTVDHLPFAEAAIEKSALKLLKEKVDLPDYKEGYGMWREAFDAGQAGVYSLTIADAVNTLETALRR